MKTKQGRCSCVLVTFAIYTSFIKNVFIMLIMKCVMYAPLTSSQLTYFNFISTIRSCSQLENSANGSAHIIKEGLLFDLKVITIRQ